MIDEDWKYFYKNTGNSNPNPHSLFKLITKMQTLKVFKEYYKRR